MSNDNQRKRNRPNHLAQYVVNTDELCDDENEPKKRRVDHRVRHQRPDPRTGHELDINDLIPELDIRGLRM